MGKAKRAKRNDAVTQNRDVVRLPGAVQYAVSGGIYSSSYPLTIVEAAGIAAVRRCVSLIANAIAGREWQEWQGTRKLTTPSRIIKRPAALMSRREWVWRVIASMAFDDYAYAWMVGGVDDEGVPGSLLPVPKQAISITGLVDPWGIFPPTAYQISGVQGTISAEAIIPIRSAIWPGVPPHLVGILQMSRDVLMEAYGSGAYASQYWQAGGAPTTVLSTDQELSDPQAETIGQRWVDRRTKGAQYPAVMGKGVRADPFGADISNAVATEARREIVLEICNLFGVPSHYLNVIPTGTSQTYSNLNDEALSLERFTLGGFIDPIEGMITDLLPDDERRMVIDMRELTRPSQEARFRAWAIATGGKPFMTAEEVRTEEGMPPAMPEVETEVSNEPPPVAEPEDAPAPAEPEAVPVP